MRSTLRTPLAAAAGYSLVELLVSMGITTVVVGVTLTGLADVMKGNETVMAIAGMNNSVRAGMDLVVRDLLQVGSGLPASHTIMIPSGNSSVRVRLPGPTPSTFTTLVTDDTLPAVIPQAGLGPVIDGVTTDVLTVLMADNAFLDVDLSAVADSTVTVAAGPVLDSGPDRVTAGQLMMITKGSVNILVQVTGVNPDTRVLTFADNDSLRLNQSAAESGNLPALNATAPAIPEDPGSTDPDDVAAMAAAVAATTISRIRMITYYLDATTEPDHPRLVRRINNGSPTAFTNTEGTAVATDVVDLQFTFDLSNGDGNPAAVEMNADDMTEDGTCDPEACGRTQIRKVNVSMTARPPAQLATRTAFLSNTLRSQVSLRAMAFVDRYR